MNTVLTLDLTAKEYEQAKEIIETKFNDPTELTALGKLICENCTGIIRRGGSGFTAASYTPPHTGGDSI